MPPSRGAAGSLRDDGTRSQLGRHAALGVRREAGEAGSARAVPGATDGLATVGGLARAIRFSKSDLSWTQRALRAQAALQRREFGTNGKRQTKTAACEEIPSLGLRIACATPA